MSSHPTDFQGSVIDALRDSIERAVPDSQAQVTGGGGHFSIEVVSPVFAGKSMLESQRLVYAAIAHLMKGDFGARPRGRSTEDPRPESNVNMARPLLDSAHIAPEAIRTMGVSTMPWCSRCKPPSKRTRSWSWEWRKIPW